VCRKAPGNVQTLQKRRMAMAVSGKYGKLKIPKVGAEEPVFILRAQDKLAGAAMAMYQALAASHGSKVAKSVRQEIAAFKKWKGAKKIPD